VAVISLPIPEDGAFNGSELDYRLQGLATQRQKLVEEGKEATDVPIVRKIEHDFVSGINHAEPSPHTEQLTTGDSEYHQLGDPEWFPGSIFLQIGPPYEDNEIMHTNQRGSTNLPNIPNDNPLVPTMIRVKDQYRFPMFPLEAIFGVDENISPASRWTSDLTDLRELLDKHAIFACPKSGVPENAHKDYANGRKYLLLIRPVAGPGRALVEEVWRLWRYCGGRRFRTSWAPKDELY
jgi:hypothetical protein